jgi:hypothetical protein
MFWLEILCTSHDDGAAIDEAIRGRLLCSRFAFAAVKQVAICFQILRVSVDNVSHHCSPGRFS